MWIVRHYNITTEPNFRHIPATILSEMIAWNQGQMKCTLIFILCIDTREQSLYLPMYQLLSNSVSKLKIKDSGKR